jgi:hypothetical protein
MLSFAEAIINTSDVLQARNASIVERGYDGMRSDMHERITAALTSSAPSVVGKLGQMIEMF